MALISISVMISDVEQFYVLFDHLYSMYLFKSFALFFFFSFFGHAAGTWDLSSLWGIKPGHARCIGNWSPLDPREVPASRFESSVLLLLSSGSSFYILDISLFLDTWFVNIFFHSVGCSFTLWIVFFWCTKDFVICFFLCFWCHIWLVQVRYHEGFTPVF